jgi:hypothetical protein
MKIEEWKFRTDKVSDQRLRSLKQDLSFSAIAERVVAEMTNVEFKPEAGDREAKGRRRARFYFRVGADTLDLFFNGAQGYRAQYYLDPELGIKCNRRVLDTVTDKLVEAVRNTSQDLMTMKEVQKSLESESAKIWIDEDKSTLNQTSRDPDEIQALEVPRWVAAMHEVLLAWSAGQSPDPTIKTRALLGVQAPEGECLKVLGAWIDDNGQEYVVPSKVNRAQEIHQYGFS